MTRVCVQGLWHLGSVTAACLASIGHDVIGFDYDHDVVEGLRAGRAPVFEPGLDRLIEAGLSSGRLRFLAVPDELPPDMEIHWITYDTPVDEDDVADTSFVLKSLASVLPFLSVDSTVLVSSQMPVGSVRQMEAVAITQVPEKRLGIACAPENLRLGKALDVFLHPDRIVVGTRNNRDRMRIARLLAPISEKIEWMSVESAEMTKHAINAFLATSVVFANEIASICEMVGADAKEVERGLKSEQRIGPKAYVSPGGAFAGGTLARDIDYLGKVSASHQLAIPLLQSVKTSNDLHKSWARRRLSTQFPNLKAAVVVVWGLTYKPGTDTLRRSLVVELCDWLLEEGAIVRIHDPMIKQLPKRWDGRVQRYDDPVEALNEAKVLVVGTEWPQYREISPGDVTHASPNLTVLDPNRFLSSFGTEKTLRYIAVGTPFIDG